MTIIEKMFSEFEQELKTRDCSVFDLLAPEFGKVYVVAITREECPACRRQKPRLLKLASEATSKYGGRVVFTRILVKYSEGFKEESLRSKELFRHYFYPTNLILLRTPDRGVVELYRNVSPTMGELGRGIRVAAEIVSLLEEEKQ